MPVYDCLHCLTSRRIGLGLDIGISIADVASCRRSKSGRTCICMRISTRDT